MKIIFHIPFAINTDVASGTNIRPIKILNAMLGLGHDVEVVKGGNKERRSQIDRIKREIKNGKKYDLLYSESSTLPTLLTEKHHLPSAPFMDFEFFSFCKSYGIPVGLYYRDIHWNFAHYPLSGIKKAYSHFFYHFDIKKYNKLLDVLFLQSYEMKKYIPGLDENIKIVELPPGVDQVFEHKSFENPKNQLKIIYVGGLGKLYQLHEFINAAQSFSKIDFSICTRKEDWNAVKSEYESILQPSKNIHLIHQSGDELDKKMPNYDLASIIVKPTDYWSFVLPLKLFYYLSFQIPVIASKGTRAAKFVDEHNVGWVVDYNEKAIESTFNAILNNPESIAEKQNNIKKIHSDITWEARVNTIIKTLTSE
ncbi:MAG: glycosyltransferase [Chitinophagales bacterium]